MMLELVILHIFLSKKKMTTYEYIIKRREEKKKKEEAKAGITVRLDLIDWSAS